MMAPGDPTCPFRDRRDCSAPKFAHPLEIRHASAASAGIDPARAPSLRAVAATDCASNRAPDAGAIVGTNAKLSGRHQRRRGDRRRARRLGLRPRRRQRPQTPSRANRYLQGITLAAAHAYISTSAVADLYNVAASKVIVTFSSGRRRLQSSDDVDVP